MPPQPAWECDICPDWVITAPTQEKVDAMVSYHMRTKHGQKRIYAPEPRRSTGSTVSDVVGDVVEGIFEGIGKAIGSIFD